MAIHLLWWLVLYASLAHGIAGAYNLLVAGAVLSVVTFVLMPFGKGDAKQVRPLMLRQIGFASGLLSILVLVWFGHGWPGTRPHRWAWPAGVSFQQGGMPWRLTSSTPSV